MSTHEKYSPSSGDRWATCTASHEKEAKYPNETNKYAEAGTSAHTLLENSIQRRMHPTMVDKDHEAVRGVSLAYDLVAPYFGNKEYQVYSEVKVTLSEGCGGTADLILISPDGEMAIIDYKNGFGIVEADCIQLLIYSKAALLSLGFMAPKEITKVTAVIVQPNAQHPDGPIRRHERTVDQLEAEINERVLPAIETIESGLGVYAPSEKACKYCKHRGNCEALAKEALEKTQSYFTPVGALHVPVPEDVGALTMEQKVQILEARGLFNIFLSAVEKNITTTILSGTPVPGLKLVAGRSQRKWSFDTEEETVTFLKEELKFKARDIFKQKLQGPATIEKLVDPAKRGGKKKQELLKQAIMKPEGKATLVAESDKRPAIAGFFKDETVKPETVKPETKE